MAGLRAGEIAPGFTARRVDGTPLTLDSLRGRFVLIYFYPMDDTPGCTTEACSLNDNLDAFADCGADVIGVSTQSDASHDRFRAHHGLRFALASDADRVIADAYGVGRSLGILPLVSRESFLVGPDGRIAEVWNHVNPAGHAAEVLDAIRRHTVTPPRRPTRPPRTPVRSSR